MMIEVPSTLGLPAQPEVTTHTRTKRRSVRKAEVTRRFVMKKLLSVSLLSIGALLPLRAQAQVLCTLGPLTPPYDPIADMPASAAAQAELKKLKSLLCPKGCGKVLLAANATTPNAATVTDGVGTSKI